MVKYRLLYVIFFSLFFSSCYKEKTSYNPALEGTYLCEAHIEIPEKNSTFISDDVVYGGGIEEGYIDIVDSIIHLSFITETSFQIDELGNNITVFVNEDSSVNGIWNDSFQVLSGFFDESDGFTFTNKVVKIGGYSGGFGSFVPTYVEANDTYYCIKQ